MDYPTLGPWVCDFIEERFVYGPGSMQGMPVVLDEDQKEILWYAYEHFPRGHTEYGEDRSGRRRFQRVAMSVRKGSAKCLAPNTLLITERGRVRADELRVGDSVLSHRDGKSLFRRVAAVEEQPVTAMYRVRTSSGREIETSIGHPFLTAGTQWRTGMPKRWKYTSCDPAAGTTAWSDVQDLASGDRIVVGLDWLPEGGDVDLGWLLGVLVGDACGDGRFSNSDVEISDRVRSHFDLTELPHVQDGQFYMRGSRDFLREHGLFGKNAYSKTTPPVVLSGGRDTALGYLAGLLDTDGSTILRQQGKKWTRVVEWYSVSKSLMEDVQHLLAGVGINGMLRACHSKYKGQDYLSWRVVVSDHAQVAELAEMLPVVRARNVENMRLFSETLDTKGKFADAKLDKVVSVERISDGVTIGVEIEDTHVHVTNGLVTHNTELLAWVVAAEIHPEAPVRFAGYDATLLGGMKSGRPVTNPYVPMLAYTKDQVSELGYGALQSILETCDDSHLFKITDKEIVRLNSAGRPDGKAVPLAGTPGALDGARTTMQALDEPLALDTPVPTTAGWKTMAELTLGDYVYDRHGSPVLVLGGSEVHEGRDCYRVTFKNGDSVVTDGSHRWKAVSWTARAAGEKVVTTKEMFDAGVNTSAQGPRWRLPRGNGYDGVEASLPIDPYLLGLWLGDGATKAGYIHTHVSEYPILSKGFENTLAKPGAGTRATVARWLPKGLRSKLRLAGLLGNKHIPEVYRFSSREQRLELLAGLIDSDGWVGENGSTTFVQGKESLAREVMELAQSLGWSASINSQEDARSRTGWTYKAQFCALESRCRLERKHSVPRTRNRNSAWPTVVSIEPVESVPVRCIEVDNDDHLFVFGKSSYLTHNTHRLHLPNHKAAIETMLNNLPKRPLEDPWQFSTTTAGEPGQDSYAEDEYREGMENWEGRKSSKGFFFMHRQANDGAKFDTMENRIKAIREATGPGVLSWGSKQIIGIAEMWDREGADKQYLERVWANRWTQTDAQAFDRDQFAALGDPSLKIPDGAFITLGFDGAVRDDSTAIVATDIKTGVQNILGLWERPADLGNDEDGRPLDWRVPEQEVMDTFTDAFKRFEVWRLYADPPHWMELIGKLGGLYPDQVVEFWTKNLNQMYYAIKNYQIAVQNGDMAFDGDPDFVRHAGNAGKRMDRGVDEDNQPKFRLAKIEQKRKFDAVVAAILSWEARMDALAAGAEPEPKQYMPERVR